MSIKNNINLINSKLPAHCKLIAVSKNQSIEKIEESYSCGQRIFGENRVPELENKYKILPKDIEWHMIGHLQTNKIKYIAPFVALIHSVDSLKLLEQIHLQGHKNNRVINCLLQVHIAQEETKFGWNEEELLQLVNQFPEYLTNIKVQGLMGMATLTNHLEQIRSEFKHLKSLFENIKKLTLPKNIEMNELSMGMSSDFQIAVEEGSTLVRIGTSIFGDR